MRNDDVARAVGAASLVARLLDLAVDDAVVLSNSNRLVVRLLPADIVARVASVEHFASASLELDVAAQLAPLDCPIAGLDPRVEPRVFDGDGFEVTLWAHHEPVPARTLPPAEYANALERLHAGLRHVVLASPNAIDRIIATLDMVTSRDATPELSDEDRALLINTLSERSASITSRGAAEQPLHGEPHPWNLLDTTDGVRFIDFENACRGPIEYDLAWVPDNVVALYPAVDRELLTDCRAVVLAIIAAHRWSRDDHHPSGRESGHAFLDALRHGPPWPALDEITW